MSTNLVPYADLERMAKAVAASGLFGVKNVNEAIALMAVAQAEGLHPAAAARDYHVIQGRPTLKADAMLARFQAAGGKVEWHDYNDTKAEATFSHPAGGSVRISWDMARAKLAGLEGKEMYQKYRRQMLRSRVVSEGIRTVYPGVAVGMYTPEEIDDQPRRGNGQAPIEGQATDITPPEGYEDWKADMTALADEGIAALQSSWGKSKTPLRLHVIKHDEQWWLDLKAKAESVANEQQS